MCLLCARVWAVAVNLTCNGCEEDVLHPVSIAVSDSKVSALEPF